MNLPPFSGSILPHTIPISWLSAGIISPFVFPSLLHWSLSRVLRLFWRQYMHLACPIALAHSWGKGEAINPRSQEICLCVYRVDPIRYRIFLRAISIYGYLKIQYISQHFVLSDTRSIMRFSCSLLCVVICWGKIILCCCHQLWITHLRSAWLSSDQLLVFLLFQTRIANKKVAEFLLVDKIYQLKTHKWVINVNLSAVINTHTDASTNS